MVAVMIREESQMKLIGAKCARNNGSIQSIWKSTICAVIDMNRKSKCVKNDGSVWSIMKSIIYACIVVGD